MLLDTEINISFFHSFIHFHSSIVLMHNNKTLQTNVIKICICNVWFTTSRHLDGWLFLTEAMH